MSAQSPIVAYDAIFMKKPLALLTAATLSFLGCSEAEAQTAAAPRKIHLEAENAQLIGTEVPGAPRFFRHGLCDGH